MEYFALFNVLILILFLISRQLTSEIYLFTYQLTNKERISTSFLAFLFFPGVVIHELSHYLCAKLLGVQTGKISLLPKREGEYVKLGSVSVVKSNIVKEFLIGIAPLFVGIFIILSAVYFMLQDFSSFNILKIVLSIYVIFVVSNTMYASRKDFQAALPFMTAIIMVGIASFIVGVRLPDVSVEWLPDIDMIRIFYMGSLYLGIPIVVDIIFILLLRFFNRVW